MYPAFWTRWSFGGVLFTNETWTCNMTMGTPGGAGVVPISEAQWWTFCDENLTKAHTAFKAFYGHANSLASDKSSHIWTKAAVLNEAGNYVGTRAPAYTEAVPVTVGPAVALTPQTAIVLSNMTAIARGPGHSGRIYVPAGSRTSPIFDNTGHITYAGLNLWLAAYKTLIETMNAFTIGGSLASPRVSVVSKVAATSSRVTNVRIGDVYDTQRRRRESIEENYLSSSITQTRES